MFAHISAATLAGGENPNEDYFLVSNSWALVLDGVTRYPDDGCVHDVPWFVASLGTVVARQLDDDALSLRAALARGIGTVAQKHEATCDVSNPVSPAATIAMVRYRAGVVEWLVLGDCAVTWTQPGTATESRSDERLAQLVDPAPAEMVGGIRRYGIDYLRQVRNQPGGFWVASSDVRAADQAYVGQFSVSGEETVGLFSDGLTRLVERYGRSWDDLMGSAAKQGLWQLLTLLRETESTDPGLAHRAKRHDDATGVMLWL